MGAETNLKLLQKLEFHYFFFGHCTEDILSDYINTAEGYGAELFQIIPGMIPLQSNIALSNGHPKMIQVFRLFMRCQKKDWVYIRNRMENDAQKEKSAVVKKNLS